VFSVSTWAKDIYTANYELYWGSMKVGTVERKLSQNGDTYNLSSIAKPQGLAKLFSKGIVEKSRFRLNGGKVLSLEYYYEQRGKEDRTIKHRYQWSTNALNIDKPQKMTVNNIAANTIDLLSFQHLVSMGLASGKTDFSGSVYKKSTEPDLYTLKVKGKEKVDTPAGKLVATRIGRTNAKGKNFNLWCAESLSYLPVKIEYTTRKGDLARMLLTKVKIH